MYLNFTKKEDPTEDGSHSTRAPMIIAVMSSLLAVAVLMVASRIFVGAKLGRLAIEDAVIVVATV